MIKQAAIIGGGVIGAGWAARLLANDVNTTIYDPAPETEHRVLRTIDNADAAYAKLTAAPRPTMNTPQFAKSVADAVCDAEFVFEAVPERMEIKRAVYAEIESAANPKTIVASSTSGLLPSELQQEMKHPQRFLVAHPFNPVYLLPLVELAGGEKTTTETIDKTAALATALGMHPLRIRKEIDAFVADRLLEAAWREALWLIHDGVATTADIDAAVTYGFGLRWAQMGIFETYRIAGGDGGMGHFLQQFGPSLKWPWTKLSDVPELTDKLTDAIVAQSEEQSGQHSVSDLERIRDDNLIAFLGGLKNNNWGAGKVLDEWERQLFARATLPDSLAPARTLSRRVPKHWTDYNGHMNESRYLECFSDASDVVMRLIGANADYVAAGNSYFTVETHIRNLQETRANDWIYADSTVLLAEGKKLKLFHELKNADGEIVATGEHMLIHVNLQTRRSSQPSPEVAAAAAKFAAAAAKLPTPEGAGRL